MTYDLLGVCIALLGVVSPGDARPAAGSAPLLVAVEPSEDAEVSGSEVRSAVAAELHRLVLAPGEPGEREAVQVLVVAVDGTHIRMSLRDGPHGVVSREIPTPTHDRLQAISWLAGNVARDQLEGAEAPAPEGAPPEPKPLAPPAFEPPPRGEPMLALKADDLPRGGSPWSFTVAVGPTVVPFRGGGALQTTKHLGQMFALEAQLERTARDFLGLAAELGTVEGQISHVLSVAGFVGARKRFSHWAGELTFGPGIEAVRMRETSFTLTTHADGSHESGEISSIVTVPALFVRLTSQAVVSLSPTVDAVLSLNLHGTIHRLEDNFAALTIGARLHLP